LRGLAATKPVSHPRRFRPRPDLAESIPLMLQENIETAGNKTDATAVWLVTDQVPRGTWFAGLDRRWPFIGAASVAATY
jgi:hypothetical protein